MLAQVAALRDQRIIEKEREMDGRVNGMAVRTMAPAFAVLSVAPLYFKPLNFCIGGE